MKDITITGKRIKTELFMLLYCYIAANLVNVFAIIYYQTSWLELFTWQRFIMFIGFLFYLVTVLVRGVIYLLNPRKVAS
jgi:phosphotransferase system  glucose/maltose/N-acetylglucosamine-specific IIC component